MQGKPIYSSQKIPGVRVYQAFTNRDERGVFVKILEHGFLKNGTQAFGEIYQISAEKGAVRACHFHRQATEYFCVTSGRGKLTLKWKGQVEEFQMDSNEPTTVVIPPEVFHKVEGMSDETMKLLAYSDKAYDSNNPDTFSGENNDH